MLSINKQTTAFILFVGTIAFNRSLSAESTSAIAFDVASVAAARTVEPAPGVFVPEGYRWVQVHLDISSLIDSAQKNKPHEFLYTLHWANRDSRVMDYSPRTQLSDTVIGGIQVEESKEKSKNLGLSVKGSYIGMIHGDGGADVADKVCNRTKFEKVAPQEIVYAAGTIDRGQGVYFKLRSTATHVLDGQKRFSVTLQVPNDWRGDLMTARMNVVQSVRSFPSLEREPTITSRTRFQIAVFDASDQTAHRWAQSLAEAEQVLHGVAVTNASAIRDRSLPTIFHQLAAAFEVIDPRISENWLQRTLYGSVDPYFDKQIRKLPIDVKVAVLDYLEAKSKFRALTHGTTDSQEAHSELAVN
ncbi:MAG: hypothetical protein R3C05_06025 [Pirellulaceae bacterium]